MNIRINMTDLEPVSYIYGSVTKMPILNREVEIDFDFNRGEFYNFETITAKVKHHPKFDELSRLFYESYQETNRAKKLLLMKRMSSDFNDIDCYVPRYTLIGLNNDDGAWCEPMLPEWFDRFNYMSFSKILCEIAKKTQYNKLMNF